MKFTFAEIQAGVGPLGDGAEGESGGVSMVEGEVGQEGSRRVPLTTNRLGRLFYLRTSMARSFIALTKPFSMTPHCLGTDDCTSINHTHPFTISLQFMQFPTTTRTKHLHTWFGFLVPPLH